jgi:PHD/YefM family antitoxin component YafN of YafNO toxin-antitoxin module
MINTVSITELKQNTAKVVNGITSASPVVILQRSKVRAIIVDPKHFEKMEQALEDAEDLRAIEERRDEPRIPFDDYFKKRFEKSMK